MSTIGPRIDLTGKKFGRLQVMKYSRKEKRKSWKGYFHFWKCLCDCGKEIEVLHEHLLSGHTKSCGCLKVDKTIKRSTKHGGANSRLYNIWRNMKARCSNPSHPDYEYYGERGIHVCDEWDRSFISFRDWALSNGYADHLTIERIDVNKGYMPSNCRFATMKDQTRNKRNNIIVKLNGKNRLFIEVCDQYGINPNQARRMYYYGKEMEEILKEDGIRPSSNF